MTRGIVTQVSGSVVDVKFETGRLPKIKEALSVIVGGSRRVMEVAQHIGGDRVRCIMLSESEGLARGMKVTAYGSGLQVPVGTCTLGRMFNVLGETIDGGPPMSGKGVTRWPIHRKAPSFAQHVEHSAQRTRPHRHLQA